MKAQDIDCMIIKPNQVEPQTSRDKGFNFHSGPSKEVENNSRKASENGFQAVGLKEAELQKAISLAVKSNQSAFGLHTFETKRIEEIEISTSLIHENKSESVHLCSDNDNLVLWRRPISTMANFLKELLVYINATIKIIISYNKIISFTITTLFFLIYLINSYGSDYPVLLWAQRKSMSCLYWFSLGFLSSAGLGSGIHTFALYLGPHIASVTVAEKECGDLNARDSPVEGSACHQDPSLHWAVSVWHIMSKVRLESCMWGLGTAAGELPPYLIGRASSTSGHEDRANVLREFDELQRKMEECPESLSVLDRTKLLVRHLVVKAGFWGILLCASIPNPFFDLAGITCGNFMVPFWTFFGATVIGKAAIKTSLQQVFVILMFNNEFLAWVVEILSKIPLIGKWLQKHFSRYVTQQKEKFNKRNGNESSNSGWFSKAYHMFVICTFFYFFVSIVNSMAQNYRKRLEKNKLTKTE